MSLVTNERILKNTIVFNDNVIPDNAIADGDILSDLAFRANAGLEDL